MTLAPGADTAHAYIVRALLIAIAACGAPAVAPPANHVNAQPMAVAGPRAVIVHRFLARPISVSNPTDATLDVATATDSVMLVEIALGSDVSMLLAMDGTFPVALRPLDRSSKVVREGHDDAIAWRISDTGGRIGVDAINLATGVMCDVQRADPPTIAIAERVIAACRDIRAATPGELAGARVFRG